MKVIKSRSNHCDYDNYHRLLCDLKYC